MLGLGASEVAIILLFGFLIFGPDKLPEIAQTVGRFIRQFRTAQNQVNEVIKKEVYDPLKDIAPLTNPFAGILDDRPASSQAASPATEAGQSAATAASDAGTAAADGSSDNPASGNGSETDNLAAKPDPQALQAALAEQAKTRRALVLAEPEPESASPTPAGSPSPPDAAVGFAQRRAQLEAEQQDPAAQPDRTGE